MRASTWVVLGFVWSQIGSAQAHTPAPGGAVDADQPLYETSIVVAPSPPPPTASTRRVDAATVKLTPRRSGDDLLRLVPGLLLSQHGAEGKARQIFLRGFDAVHGADVETTLDGVPLNERSNVHGQGYLDLGLVIPEIVHDVEAIKGAVALDQGQFATAGSVRLGLGLDHDDRGSTVALEVGTTRRVRVLGIQAVHGGADAPMVAVEALRDRGFGENRETERVNVTARGALYQRPDGARLIGLIVGYGARFGEPGVLPLAGIDDDTIGRDDSLSPDTHGRSARGIAALRWLDDQGPTQVEATAWGQARALELQENFTGWLHDPDHGDRLRQRHEDRGGGGRLDVTHQASRRVTWRGGASVTADVIDQDEDRLDEDLMPVERSRSLDGLELGWTMWAGARVAPWERVRVAIGSRLEVLRIDATDLLIGRHGAQTFVEPAPRLTAAVKLTDGWTLYTGAGRGLRPPEARAVVRVPSDHENAEATAFSGGEASFTTADGGELGLRASPSSSVTFDVAAFGTYIGHESVFDHVSATNLELNATRRLGVEVGVEVTPLRGATIRADVTATQARFVESGNPIPGAPPLLATLEGRYDRGPWGVGARVIGLAARPLAHGATSSGYVVADVLARWRHRDFALELAVENVTDTTWDEGSFHYASAFDRDAQASHLPSIHISPGSPLQARVAASFTY